jgi:hypothetical protein
LTLPEGVSNHQNSREERFKAAKGNFPELLRAIQNSDPAKASKFQFSHIEHYHNLRNMLYHQGNQVTAVPMHQLEGYAKLAVNLLREYLEVNLSSKLKRPFSAGSFGAADKGDREAEGRKRWTIEMFFEDVKKRLNKQEIGIVNQLYEFSRQNAAEVRMGTGAESGSFTFILLRNNTSGSVFSVYSNGDFSLNLGYLEKICTREEIAIFRKKIATISSLAEIQMTDKYYFIVKCASAFPKPQYIEQFQKEVLELKNLIS